ncbi:S1/P1 nuclease [Robiginitalea marina]|uniref:S1/P1 nuclease n=1 Tax=Robiginitalea marina TaxID=2954105 RepID=A0ABT1AZN4_9FLAO|nr:S1/P1 nuclease [Robiginitalea marina]MCO5725506.1 S1/P1 nuclease [Robiginitalea marina]
MKKILLLLFILPLMAQAGAPYWGKTGHRVVGEVAQMHLSRKARKAVAELLGGEGLAEVSNFADDIKSDRTYDRFTPWHYVNFGPDEAYGEGKLSPEGDLVVAIEKCIAVLETPETPRDEKVFYLKMLVHFIGDLHQPMHLGREEDRGGNDIQVQWFGRGSNLHRLWDSNLIDSYGMSYTELAGTLPRWSRHKMKAAQQGTLLDWVGEVHQVTNEVYDSVEAGEKLGYDYSYQWWDTVEQQLLLGGLRLAEVLNRIYG